MVTLCGDIDEGLTERKFEFYLRIGLRKGRKSRRQNDLLGTVGQRYAYGALF